MRFLQLMRGASVDTMLELYGQSATTVHNDFHLFIFVARKYLVPLLVKMPLKTSPEYDGLVGQGVFVTCMPRIIYLGDLTFVEFGSPPPEEEAEFYCAHKKKHGAYFLTLDDGTGEGRAIAGPYPGSVKDGRAMAMSDLTARLKNDDRTIISLVCICEIHDLHGLSVSWQPGQKQLATWGCQVGCQVF